MIMGASHRRRPPLAHQYDQLGADEQAERHEGLDQELAQVVAGLGWVGLGVGEKERKVGRGMVKL